MGECKGCKGRKVFPAGVDWSRSRGGVIVMNTTPCRRCKGSGCEPERDPFTLGRMVREQLAYQASIERAEREGVI